MRRITRTHAARRCLAATLPLVFAAVVTAQDIPDRPEAITFQPLAFEPPQAADYRHVLSNGVPVYLAPSREVPLVNIVFTFRGGAYLDPESQVGLASTTAALVRRGGSTTVSAEVLDEQFDFLATDATVMSGLTASAASLNCLTSTLDASLALFMDMLRNPGFQASRFAILLDELYEAMRQRNDYPEAILSREWDLLLYGQDHFEARLTTATMLQSFTGRDLQEMHRAIFHPGNLVIAVNGDFEPEAMLQRLERACAGWAKGKPAPDPPAPAFETKPGVFHVQRDIPQGTVRLGLRCIPRDHPDAIPLALMNDILGGGGFTSRITKRVRDDEGLAYSAGSALLPRVHYPGEWRASVQSKNRTVALSIRLILEEIDRLRTDPVLDAELRTAANALIETFPRTFESKRGMLAVFVSDELTGRPADYWARFRQRVGAVTTADIQRVARSWLDPDGVVILAVGDWAAIAPGDLEGRASMGDVFGGRVTHLPLRDPLTLEPIPGTTPDD